MQEKNKPQRTLFCHGWHALCERVAEMLTDHKKRSLE